MNGSSYGFFPSSRGLKQGDPLSPILFIIAVEVLSRSLNKLSEDAQFKGFGMPKWSEKVNHLSYIDDTILFCLGQKKSIKKMMKVLNSYKKISGQLINLNKSFIYLHEKIPIAMTNRIRWWIGIGMGSFPFIWGIQIFMGEKRSVILRSW